MNSSQTLHGPIVRISRTPSARADIPLPAYATKGSAGMDICAAVEADIVLDPGQRELIPSGFSIELPAGLEAQIRPRSGLAIKHGIGVLNSPGTIDADYRGEVKVVLVNHGEQPFTVRRGDRVAQMIVSRFERIEWEETTHLTETDRGSGGFGHTGVKAPL